MYSAFTHQNQSIQNQSIVFLEASYNLAEIPLPLAKDEEPLIRNRLQKFLGCNTLAFPPTVFRPFYLSLDLCLLYSCYFCIENWEIFSTLLSLGDLGEKQRETTNHI